MRYQQGDLIRHRSNPYILGRVLGVEDGLYSIEWLDYKRIARHTEEFIDLYYVVPE